MSDPVSDGYEYCIVSPEAHAGLTCRFLKPAEFHIADLPSDVLEFAASPMFMPLAIAVTQYCAMVLANRVTHARPEHRIYALHLDPSPGGLPDYYHCHH